MTVREEVTSHLGEHSRLQQIISRHRILKKNIKTVRIEDISRSTGRTCTQHKNTTWATLRRIQVLTTAWPLVSSQGKPGLLTTLLAKCTGLVVRNSTRDKAAGWAED